MTRALGNRPCGRSPLQQVVGRGYQQEEHRPHDPECAAPADADDHRLGQGRENGLAQGIASISQAQGPSPRLGKPRGQRGRSGKGRNDALAEGGQDSVKNEELPEVGGDTAEQVAQKDEQSPQGEQDARAQPVEQPTQQGRKNNACQPHGGKDGRGGPGAAPKAVPQSQERHRRAVLHPPFNNEIGEHQAKYDPAVMPPANHFAKEGVGQLAGPRVMLRTKLMPR